MVMKAKVQEMKVQSLRKTPILSLRSRMKEQLNPWAMCQKIMKCKEEVKFIKLPRQELLNSRKMLRLQRKLVSNKLMTRKRWANLSLLRKCVENTWKSQSKSTEAWLEEKLESTNMQMLWKKWKWKNSEELLGLKTKKRLKIRPRTKILTRDSWT